MSGGTAQRKRRPQGELRNVISEFLARRDGTPATISEIQAGVEAEVGPAPASSVRSALQDERFFKRVSRGVFCLRD